MLLLGAIAPFVLYLNNSRETTSRTPQAPIQSSEENPAPTALVSEAEALFEGDRAAQQALAAEVIEDIQRGISAEDFNTGSARFDGEWAVGSYQMAVLGLGQVILTHHELRDDYLPMMAQSIDRLLAPTMNAFGTEAWGEEGLATLESANGHAYLGYTNLALSMLRLHQPDTPFAQINDQLTEAFVRRLEAAPHGIIETYPQEAYPADLAAVVASIGLYDRATGKDHQPLLDSLLRQFQQNWVDSETGLVFQAVNAASGIPTDVPRASGTVLSAYFLSFVDADLAQALFNSVVDSQKVEFSGLVGIREYPVGQEGAGDVDSGELIQGISPSATAFALGGARLVGDRVLYETIYDTIQILGTSPIEATQGATLLDSPLSRAILLAMLTANP